MVKPVIRLSFGKSRPLRKPEKHVAAVEDWAAAFSGTFPGPGGPSRPCEHWHLPVDQRLVPLAQQNPDYARRLLQALLEAGRHLVAARPEARTRDTVYVAVGWPDMFMSEVGVFLDPAYGRDFERRTHRYQTWTLLNPRARSLVAELGLILPEGWVEHGYHERQEDPDDEAPGGIRVFEDEIWVLREPIEGT
ncbi:DUF3916 domain-containing protein [Phreatobacter aquaticus]|uniref:DUF3916 domain-containing protein n=1 Tax=Phreatobacter aquaticus TaxID=2570229 RepID=A0A4D7QJ65_9HYPH|nr:DUF3916 domain-containing protein [Phreatobacter aquaticus]QCK87095.1 DUF3916 domain-containing protein [Phreatobacter aquaticus]